MPNAAIMSHLKNGSDIAVLGVALGSYFQAIPWSEIAAILSVVYFAGRIVYAIYSSLRRS